MTYDEAIELVRPILPLKADDTSLFSGRLLIADVACYPILSVDSDEECPDAKQMTDAFAVIINSALVRAMIDRAQTAELKRCHQELKTMDQSSGAIGAVDAIVELRGELDAFKNDHDYIIFQRDVEIENLKDQVEKLKKEVDHWKANHDEAVARCALLRQRPDLPVDRIPVYDRMTQQAEKIERLHELVQGLEGRLEIEREVFGDELAACKAEITRQRIALEANASWFDHFKAENIKLREEIEQERNLKEFFKCAAEGQAQDKAGIAREAHKLEKALVGARRSAESTIISLLHAADPLMQIAEAHKKSMLDEHRPEWGDVNADEVVLVSGRGGKSLLTLAQVFDAVNYIQDAKSDVEQGIWRSQD